MHIGRGAFSSQRSQTERTGGAARSDPAGISSEKEVRIFPAVSLRFPEEGSSAQGQSGANARPKGVADAHPVNIPELPTFRYHDGGTQEASRAHDWTCGFRHVGDLPGKSGGSHSLRCHVEGLADPQADDAMLPRKASKEKSECPCANRHR